MVSLTDSLRSLHSLCRKDAGLLSQPFIPQTPLPVNRMSEESDTITRQNVKYKERWSIRSHGSALPCRESTLHISEATDFTWVRTQSLLPDFLSPMTRQVCGPEERMGSEVRLNGEAKYISSWKCCPPNMEGVDFLIPSIFHSSGILIDHEKWDKVI